MLDLKLFTSFFDKNLPVYVGYSGGVDSHALLSLCVRARELNYFSHNITAIHINHGISVNADHWQEHCQQVCAALNVNFIARKVILAKPSEASARDARLEQFKVCIGDSPHNLLFAHHALDQAETVLFRLFRGTSIDGIAGMQVVSNILGLQIIRPLLAIDKKDILAYARQYELKYITDESNFLNKYSRNYIRNMILPIIQKRWPDVVKKINSFAKHSADLQEIINHSLDAKINSASLSIDYLQTYREDFQSHVLVKWLKHHHIVPSRKHVKIIFDEVINAKDSANPQLKLSNKYIVRSYGQLLLLDKLDDTVIYSHLWDAQSDLKIDFLNYTLLANDFAGFNGLVKVGSYGSKVKKIFQKNKVPIWERSSCILLYRDNSLVVIINTVNNSLIYQRK